MPARCRDFEGALGGFLTLYLPQIGGADRRFDFAGVRGGEHGGALEM